MARVKTGMTCLEVKQQLGTPNRKVGTSDLDIWAYDLGRFDSYNYSIRIAFSVDKVSQVYLGMELCA
jgi:hypothetical protein